MPDAPATYSVRPLVAVSMDRRRVLLIDAFTDEPLAGNPAGVVPDGDGLSEEQMRAVAREIGASETAFLTTTGAADRRIRFFTPEREVDLCGHATVASHAHLFAEGAIGSGGHTLETNAGVLDVAVEDDGTVWLTGDSPAVRPLDVDAELVADALGIDAAALRVDDLPIARATVGLPFLIVPVTYLEHLGNADPDPDAVEALADEHDAAGVYAFTFDTLGADATLHGRMWAPGVCEAEDPVTGTASGAAGAYLRHVEAFEIMPDEMTFEQGHFVDRPGQVQVRVGTDVEVGGRAVTAMDGEIVVPPDNEDEIIVA